MLRKYVDRLGKQEGLDEMIEELGDKRWNFYLDERTSVLLSQQEDEIRFSCEIGPCPKKQELLEQMLFANLGLRSTRGASLGIDSKAQTSILWYQLPLSAEYQWFYNEFEDFVSQAEYWSYIVREEELPSS